jgi:PAT family beta-lactamase induction signal transducer AmpG
MLPYGISVGFASIALPYILTDHGFSVALAAAVTALGVSANVWRFVWAPFTDLTLSLHKWYWIGIALCAGTIVMLCLIPIDKNAAGLIMAVVLISQIAATFVIAPVGGFMAKTVEEVKKGRAGGFYQVGNLGGTGIGGGVGIFLYIHYSYTISGFALAGAMLLCLPVLHYVPQVYAEKGETLKKGFHSLWKSIKHLLGSRIALFTMPLLLCPIGTGALSNVFSSVGKDWKTSADTIALVNGVLNAGVSAVGCIVGGWIADKVGRWWAFFGGGTLMALTTLVMSICVFTPFSYTVGVLTYALMLGIVNAAFTAVILYAIGKELAATKYALLSSIGNLPVVYITALDGWVHDRYSIKIMLQTESMLGLGFIALFLLILYRTHLNRYAPID